MSLTDIERDYLTAAIRGDTETVSQLEALIDAEERTKKVRLASPDALLGAALWYASNGVAVFPCQAGGKAPATRNGFKDASTDPAQIREWWATNRHYNIGLPTGHSFDVFDIDGPQGMVALGDYMDTGQFPARIGLALTPRGRHYYVPPNLEARNATGLLPGVDYRGLGGYVIAPPSRTEAGNYTWIEPLTIGTAQ